MYQSQPTNSLGPQEYLTNTSNFAKYEVPRTPGPYIHQDSVSFLPFEDYMYPMIPPINSTVSGSRGYFPDPRMYDITAHTNFALSKPSELFTKPGESFLAPQEYPEERPSSNSLTPYLLEEKSKETTIIKPLLELVTGPEPHQVKDWFITPTNVLRLNMEPSSSDVIVVYLKCEDNMGLSDSEIFLGAFSAKFNLVRTDCVYLYNLKITKEMVQGPTKGYKFSLLYSLVSKDKEIFRFCSNAFCLYSRSGFPSHLKLMREEKKTQ